MESLQEILDLVFEKLQDSMNPTAYAAWIKGIEPLKMEGSTVYLQVQTQFKRDQIIGRYLDLIAASFEDVVGFPVEVVIQYKYSDSAPPAAKPAAESFPQKYTPEEMAKNSTGGDYEYTFSHLYRRPIQQVCPCRFSRRGRQSGQEPIIRCLSTAVQGWAKRIFCIAIIQRDYNKINPDANCHLYQGRRFHQRID